MSGRSRRAIPIICAALAAIVFTGLLYMRSEMRPTAVVGTPSPARIPMLLGDYTPAFDFVDPAHGWAIVVDYGPLHRFWIFATADGAGHWKQQLAAVSSGGYAYIRFFDLRHGFAYAGSLYRTADGGRTWQQVQMPSEAPHFTFADAMHGWLLADDLYATTNGGTTWAPVGARLPPGAVADAAGSVGELAFRDGGEGWLGAALPHPAVYRTLDRGTSWQSIELPGPDMGAGSFTTTVRLTPDHGVIAIVGSPDGFTSGYYSADLGATWRAVAPLPQGEWLASASFLDDTDWWAARYGFLFITNTAGESWARVFATNLPEGWNIQPVHAIDRDHGWWTMVATSNSRDNALMVTSDGGATWRAVNMPHPA